MIYKNSRFIYRVLYVRNNELSIIYMPFINY